MGKIAFVFSGQGDQYPGMGKELFDTCAAAADVFHMCEALRPGTLRQCFEGTADELKETKNTQPCLFAMELAAAEVLMEQGIMPHAVAGFSLGEFVAATVAGIFDRETGFRLVSKRGELMQTEAEKHDTAMAAVVRLTARQVCELTARYDRLYPVKFNCPGNITVSGLMGNAGQCNYSASKAGLVGLTKSAAKELAPRGIRCNAIAPGFIRTDMTGAQEANPLLSVIPLGRMGEAEEVAEAAAYLATANYVTGEVLRADGGIAM